MVIYLPDKNKVERDEKWKEKEDWKKELSDDKWKINEEWKKKLSNGKRNKLEDLEKKSLKKSHLIWNRIFGKG